jgi:hypothetical protein
MRHHEVLGSSRGWLATARYDQIYLVNPATGEQHALPDITTMGVFVPQPHGNFRFVVSMESFPTARFGAGPPFGDNCWGPEERWKSTFHACQMPTRFYRKVVLAIGRRPGSHTQGRLYIFRGPRAKSKKGPQTSNIYVSTSLKKIISQNLSTHF